METNLCGIFPPKQDQSSRFAVGLNCPLCRRIAPLLCGFDLHMSEIPGAWDGKRALGPT